MPENISKQDKTKNIYDDGNIPEIDLQNQSETTKPISKSINPKKDSSDEN